MIEKDELEDRNSRPRDRLLLSVVQNSPVIHDQYHVSFSDLNKWK